MIFALSESPPEKEDSKKAKVVVFEVEKQIMKLIKKDSVNQKLWDDALCHITEGRPVSGICLVCLTL